MSKKCYHSDKDGKKQFIEDVIKPFVLASEIYADVKYLDNERGEWILFFKSDFPDPVNCIDITANSIAAIYIDFCRKFANIVKEKLY